MVRNLAVSKLVVFACCSVPGAGEERAMASEAMLSIHLLHGEDQFTWITFKTAPSCVQICARMAAVEHKNGGARRRLEDVATQKTHANTMIGIVSENVKIKI